MHLNSRQIDTIESSCCKGKIIIYKKNCNKFKKVIWSLYYIKCRRLCTWIHYIMIQLTIPVAMMLMKNLLIDFNDGASEVAPAACLCPQTVEP